MKRILLILMIIPTLISCSKNDDSNSDNEIVGNWKLMRAEFYGFEGENSINYSDKDIIYNFKSNGTLKVTGEENAGYPSGEYEYFFGKDYLGGNTNDPKTLLVKINTSKWIYNFIDGEMILGQSYVDGPNLVFKKE
ncbi:hypothetical protein [Salegentibacter sp. Hel_I_6]|uniref:hypothetical protein n=1 Tax=Salegentibacter sp. Hel_I_6 TaxID=1250278 RepID=UPI0012E0C1D0|nr:hypothetical protein [Salegentibacter sp. Hel_I_6]